VGQGDGEHRLLPVHAHRDEPGGQRPGGGVVGHADPQRGEVVRGPGAAPDRYRQQVGVGVAAARGGGVRGELHPPVGEGDLGRGGVGGGGGGGGGRGGGGGGGGRGGGGGGGGRGGGGGGGGGGRRGGGGGRGAGGGGAGGGGGGVGRP